MKSSSNQLLFSKCSFIAGLMGLVLLTGITTTSEAGQFEGTLWSFHLIPKNPNEKKRTGTFREEGTKLFQSRNESDQRRNLVVGFKQPLDKDETRLMFTILVGKSGMCEATKI
jgi:Tfp pilus tip-associated adhesin PilY1